MKYMHIALTLIIFRYLARCTRKDYQNNSTQQSFQKAKPQNIQIIDQNVNFDQKTLLAKK